jgi:hypothetical protein
MPMTTRFSEPPRGWPERVHYGKEAVQSFYKELAETVGGEVVIEDLIDAGDSVVLRSRIRMTGEQSGITGDMVSARSSRSERARSS